MVLFNWWNFVMGFSMLDTVRILHFDALNFIPHSSPHNCNASRSFCICTWSWIDLIVRYIKQSSANKRTCVPGSTTCVRSFMNNKNKRGPITVPWGTPDFTSAESDVLPSTTTCWLRWLRNEDIHEDIHKASACSWVWCAVPYQTLWQNLKLQHRSGFEPCPCDW